MPSNKFGNEVKADGSNINANRWEENGFVDPAVSKKSQYGPDIFECNGREALVMPIHKPGADATLRGSYRPIFLLSPFG